VSSANIHKILGDGSALEELSKVRLVRRIKILSIRD
jgi:hypothetical protein